MDMYARNTEGKKGGANAINTKIETDIPANNPPINPIDKPAFKLSLLSLTDRVPNHIATIAPNAKSISPGKTIKMGFTTNAISVMKSKTKIPVAV